MNKYQKKIHKNAKLAYKLGWGTYRYCRNIERILSKIDILGNYDDIAKISERCKV